MEMKIPIYMGFHFQNKQEYLNKNMRDALNTIIALKTKKFFNSLTFMPYLMFSDLLKSTICYLA
jgi:hypothetical protein